MRRWATGVSVVTASIDGLSMGITISSLASVTLGPPTISFSLSSASTVGSALEADHHAVVNILAADQRDISDRFAGRDGALDRFDGIATQAMPQGPAPALTGAAAILSCVVRETVSVGGHRLYLAEVLESRSTKKDPLLYFDGDYTDVVFGRRANER